MLILNILDLAKKTEVANWYKLFIDTIKWDREKILDYQKIRFLKLIKFVYANVPYYKRIMSEKKLLPEQIKSVDDLSFFPILDRDIIRIEQQNLLANKIAPFRLHKGSSSGTTGIPINYYFDMKGFSAGVAAGYALWNMSGWKPGQRNVHVWGNATSIKRWNTLSSRAKNVIFRQINIPSIHLDDPMKIEAVANKIIKFDPISIEGYSSAIYTLAQYFQQKGYILKSLKQVLTTAENLENQQRELIENVFAPTADSYGCGEVLGIATRPIHDEIYYVLEPHVIVEAMDSGIPGMKDILVTDLNNYGMPLIRYKVGDMVDNLYQPEEHAKYPLMYFKNIIGRISDIILLPNGKRFHPVNIFGGTLFRTFPEISRHKVVWNGELLKFVFEINKTPNKIELKRQLTELLISYDVSFTVEYTNKLLPTSNGKYRYLELVKKGNN